MHHRLGFLPPAVMFRVNFVTDQSISVTKFTDDNSHQSQCKVSEFTSQIYSRFTHLLLHYDFITKFFNLIVINVLLIFFFGFLL